MIKVIEFPGVNQFGEPVVQSLFPDNGPLIKTAAPKHPQIAEYIRGIKPSPRYLYVLVSALGAVERWGSNLNGDAFEAEALRHKGRDYGHETFYDAGIFLNHTNRDKNRSIGEVVKSVYNEDMWRVELIHRIDRQKAVEEGAKDLLEKLDAGQHPPTSMGCFPPGTKIDSSFGSVLIEDVKVGMGVYTRTTSSAVSSIHVRDYDGQILAIHTSDGDPVEATPEHPFWAQKGSNNPGWVHASCLSEGDFLLGSDGHFRKILTITPRCYKGKVYNFEVHGSDKSYVANGYVVHNCRVRHDVCSWCGNKAKTRAAYCIHALHYMNHVADDELAVKFGVPLGKRMCVYNPRPKFFDESYVVVGADLTSYALEKVAAAGLSGMPSAMLAEQMGITEKKASAILKAASQKKVSDIEKRIPSMGLGTMAAMHRAEPKLKPQLLEGLSGCGLPEALSTANSMGIILSPAEFQRMVLPLLGQGKLAKELDREGIVFSPNREIDDSVTNGTGPYNSLAKKMLMPMYLHRTMHAPVLEKRIIMVASGKYPSRPRKREKEASLPILDVVSAAYNGYLNNLPEKIAACSEYAFEDPEILKAIYPFISPEKTAAAGGLPLMALLGVAPLLYLYSRSLERRQAGGEELGAFQDFIRKHPIITGSGLLGLERYLASL